MLLNSHNSERSNRRFALHTWSGGTNKSKPVKVLSGVLSTYCSNCPHQTHIYHRWCTVKIHSRCSRRWFSSGLIEKSKSLKLKIKIPPTPTPDLNSLQKNEVSTHTWTRTYARAFQDGDSGLCPGTTREDRSPPCVPVEGPLPSSTARSSAVASRATQGKAGGNTVYLTQPRCPSARLGFDCRHLTTAQARRHEQFKRFFFFHGLGEKGRTQSQHLTTGTLTPRARRLLREDKKAGSKSARRRREGRRRARRAQGRRSMPQESAAALRRRIAARVGVA